MQIEILLPDSLKGCPRIECSASWVHTDNRLGGNQLVLQQIDRLDAVRVLTPTMYLQPVRSFLHIAVADKLFETSYHVS